MAHAFISYAHEDGDFGEVLIDRLELAGIAYWYPERVQAGQDWQTIDEAIKTSYALIIIVSPQSMASHYVTYEWTSAMSFGIPVIPIQFEHTHLHPRLEVLQYLDFSDRSHRNWDSLLVILRELETHSNGSQKVQLANNQVTSTRQRASAFLSYSRADTITMQRIKADLELNNINIWTDEALEPGTQSWIVVVERAIENTTCVVVMLSPNSKKSRWVREELSYAENQSKPIIPVLMSGDERDAIPLGFTLAQRIDMRNETVYQLGLEKLISAILKHHITA